jgi:hypothetical protein
MDEMKDRNGAEQQQPPAPPPTTVELSDEQAKALLLPLTVALQQEMLFEGITVQDQLSSHRRILGSLAVHMAGQLIMRMRGQDVKLDSVKRTIRDLLRGLVATPGLENALGALHPNSKRVGTELIVNDDDGTPAAKIRFEVEMIPVILIPGAKPAANQ